MTDSGAFPPEVRALIHARSGGKCERCLSRRAVQIHHRTPRQSGKHHPPWMSAASNGVDLCLVCHDWIERNRQAARDSGWLVPRGVATQPVVDRTGRWWAFNGAGEKTLVNP